MLAIQLQCACFSGSLMTVTSMCGFDLFTVIMHVLWYGGHAFYDTCGDREQLNSLLSTLCVCA